MSDPDTPAYTRRETLRRMGLGGAGLLGAGLVGGAVGRQTTAQADEGGASVYPDHDGSDTGQPFGDDAGPYGGDFAPPGWMEPDHLDATTFPPLPSVDGVRQIEMTVIEQRIEVADGSTVDAWTYQGSVPGPTIRATEGEMIRIRFRNLTGQDQNLQFHGSLHAQVFDVYPSGAGTDPMTTTDVITLGQAERAVLEFALPEIGRYMFHPHQHSIAMRGAMGWFSAV